MRGRWWVWVCSKCGGVTPPSDLSVCCFKCGRSASSMYQAPGTSFQRGVFWACGECGGSRYAPEESAKCVNCGRTEEQAASEVLARSGMQGQELVSFPNADPS
jgi:hypothetical protein